MMNNSTANDEDKIESSTSVRALVALSLLKNVGAQRILKLKRLSGTAADIFDLDFTSITSVRDIGEQTAREILEFDDWQKVDNIITKTRETGATLLTIDDDKYPPLLSQIYDPPLLLWVKGSKKILQSDAISVVGTRSCSGYGKKMAAHFVRALTDHDITIVSGLAYGIDSVAHQTAVDNAGRTVAVLGSGIDYIYPRTNVKLADRIVATGGAIISEFPLGTKPQATNFPVRNRIVSGLSMGTMVVESGLKGGSMITINSALSQNREVFAVPHSLVNPNSVGCNTLIRDGLAKLVIDVDDILNEVSHFRKGNNNNIVKEERESAWKKADLTKKQQKICQILQKGTRHIDVLAEQLECSTSSLLADLLTLEMMNCVEQQAGKYFELK